jgi:hypothetical protein
MRQPESLLDQIADSVRCAKFTVVRLNDEKRRAVLRLGGDESPGAAVLSLPWKFRS